MKLFENWYDPCPINTNEFRAFDGLGMKWGETTFVNPPYSSPEPWVDKAIEEHNKGKTIVLLLRVDTSTRWFAKLVEAQAHFFWYAGRMSFSGKDRANFATMLVILN
ncbi:MAG: DNA N-6-adenine-methyltransferase [Nitrosotalea sp.]